LSIQIKARIFVSSAVTIVGVWATVEEVITRAAKQHVITLGAITQSSRAKTAGKKYHKYRFSAYNFFLLLFFFLMG
jgi:hypothetical protein